MNIISTRLHGVLDYLVAMILIVLPFLLGFDDHRTALLVMVILGVATIVYSAMTRYEYGFVPVIPMTVHLGIDLTSGFFLALSPWIFDFNDTVFLPHLLLGVLEIVVSIFSNPHPATSKR